MATQRGMHSPGDSRELPHSQGTADFDAAVTRMTIYKQYDWSFYIIVKDMFEKSISRRNT